MPILTAIARPHRRVVPATDPLNNAVLGPSGLLAWWKADEASGSTMTDYSGNGNHATYTGAANLTLGNSPIRTGSAQCIRFTAVDTQPAATIAATGSLAIGTTSGSTFTLACFVKKTGGGSVLQKVFGMGPLNYGVRENGPNIQYRESVAPSCAGICDGGTNRVYSSNATAGTIVFLALVKNGTTFTLYENGTSAATETPSFVVPVYSRVDIFGTGSAGADPPYNGFGIVGYASDFMVYNTALNSTQLTAIAHAGGLV